MTSMYIPMCAFFFALLIFFAFVMRKKLITKETKVFSYMLMASLCDSILSITIMYIGYVNTNIPFVVDVLNKLDFMMYLIWCSGFAYYIFYVTFKDIKELNYDKIYLNNIYADIGIICIMMLLPIDLYNDGTIMYAYGPAVNLLYTVCALYILVIIISVIIGHKNITTKKYFPVYGMIFCAVVTLIIRSVNPGLIIIPIVLCYVNLILLLTLENPDIKIIGALSDAKKKAEQYANDKEIFSLNMSQKINEPLKNIDMLCSELSYEDTDQKHLDNLDAIKVNIEKIRYLVSDTLNGVSSSNFKMIEKAYNLDNLIKEINLTIKNKANKNNCNFNSNELKTNIILYGDSLKIKQVISSFANNLFKKINSLTLHYDLKKEDENHNVVFKFILPKSNISLEELNKETSIEDYENIDYDKISLSDLKKIINLLNGYLEINNKNDSETIINIIIKQQENLINDSTQLEYVKAYENMTKSKPKILIIDDDNESIKSLEKNIDKSNYEVIIAKGGQEGLEKIRNNEEFNIIFIDDTLEKLDTITTFTKLKLIDNFKIPVVFVGDLNEEREITKLLSLGFKEVLLKPIKLREVEDILNRYIKK